MSIGSLEKTQVTMCLCFFVILMEDLDKYFRELSTHLSQAILSRLFTAVGDKAEKLLEKENNMEVTVQSLAQAKSDPWTLNMWVAALRKMSMLLGMLEIVLGMLGEGGAHSLNNYLGCGIGARQHSVRQCDKLKVHARVWRKSIISQVVSNKNILPDGLLN